MRPRLADILVLAGMRERDRELAQRTLWERDRGLAVAEQLDTAADDAALLGWAAAVDGGRPHTRADRGLAAATGGAVFIGGLVGVAAAAGVFGYDGSTPINVALALALLVVLPLLLGLLAIGALAGWLPGSGFLRGLSPGGWMLALAARVSPGLHRHAAAFRGRLADHHRLLGRVTTRAAFFWSQLAGLSFQLGVVTALLILLITRDLAFGWGTTMRWADADVAAAARAIAAPWAWAWPDAVPTAELVEHTRFFRGRPGLDATTDAELQRFGDWWPFLLMTLVVYGVIPRLLLVILGRVMLRGAVGRVFRHWPERGDVLERMRRPPVDTTGRVDAGDPLAGAGTTPHLSTERLRRPDAAGPPAAVIRWSDAAADGVDAAGSLVLRAGGDRSLDDDRATIRAAVAAADDRGEAAPIEIRVKVWEPPILDFTDFLADLRDAAGTERAIRVAAVTGDRTDLTRGHFGVWERRLAGLGDPWLRFVHADAAPVSTPQREAPDP